MIEKLRGAANQSSGGFKALKKAKGRDAITNEYRFKDFNEFWFYVACSDHEKIDHHPEWSNVYNRGRSR